MSGVLAVISAGMVTPVGLDAAASCAAMRGALDGFRETRFQHTSGDPLIGADVPLPRGWVGERRQAHLAAGAMVDALERQAEGGALLVIFCVAEADRPGRPLRDMDRFAARALAFAGLSEHTRRQVVAHGRPSGIVALRRAEEALKRGEAARVLIVGADSYLTNGAVEHYGRDGRLLGGEVTNGFIPGEAAAAILCVRAPADGLLLTGLGLAREIAPIYNADARPLRADGMVAAYRQALGEAGTTLDAIDYRISDATGELHYFRQAALAEARLLRTREAFQDFWSATESIGNVGAAAVPLMVGRALIARLRGYHAGDPVLIESSADDGACGAAVLTGGPARAERAA